MNIVLRTHLVIYPCLKGFGNLILSNGALRYFEPFAFQISDLVLFERGI